MSAPRRITATEAARSFSDLLNRVRYRGEAFEVMRGREIVACLVPPGPEQNTATVRALLDRLQGSAETDADFAADLEAIQLEPPPSRDPWAT